jgi:hypothetical protein
LRVALILLSLAAGCTTVESGGAGRASFYFGATSVRIPRTQGNVSAVSVRALGMGWDGGPFLGWRSGSWITADPANCQLLVVIRSAVETANAVQIINALEGQNPCIVDYTNTLRR